MVQDRAANWTSAESTFSMKFKLRDVVRGIAHHLAARFRRRFLRGSAPVSSLADEIDFVRFCRCIGKPNSSEVEEWLSGGLDLDESEFNTVSLQ